MSNATQSRALKRLHLGCGRYYLEGYTNIDFPPAEHTVQAGLKADLYCDIVSLDFPRDSVDEIRLHHVFEHFPRPTALALICRWRDWLKVGGVLRIETPDLKTSLWPLISPFNSYQKKQQIIRHLFGSHESHWAVHWDGWYEDRLRRTLLRLGFAKPVFAFSRWGMLRNVDVTAVRDKSRFGGDDYMTAAKELLQCSLVRNPAEADIPGSEQDLLDVWMNGWKDVYFAKGNPSGMTAP